ncbi:MAG: hypothetical protein WAO04_17265, partial [Candidatus Sulfotelmatobacter sp.]
MARSKSTSGSKTNKEQTNAAGVPDVKPNLQAYVPVTAAETAAIQVKPEAKPEIRPEAKITTEPRKKLEVVKTEPRRVIPINLEDEIRRRAYE